MGATGVTGGDVKVRLATILVVGVVVFGTMMIPTASGQAARVRGLPDCTITGTRGDDRLRGTAERDVICALAGDDFVNGRGGNDLILLGPGEDGFNGGGGNDQVRGGSGPDFGTGGPGDDNLFAQKGNDLIISDTVGSDLISGGDGDDSCLSAFDGADDDSVLGGNGTDTFNADAGDSTSTVENGPTPCEGG